MSKLVSAESIGCICITEGDAGSDVGNIKTSATRDGDHYVLNGMKHFITSGGDADVYTIIAMTNKSKGARGASLFIVDKGFCFLSSSSFIFPLNSFNNITMK